MMSRTHSKTTRRYVIVGASVYLFEVAVITAGQSMGLSAVTAIAVSFWLGLLLSFGLQKLVTFGDKRLHHRVVLPQFLAFTVLVLFNFGFTLIMSKLLSGMLPAVIIRTLALGVTTLWNFYLYKTRIFKGNDGIIY